MGPKGITYNAVYTVQGAIEFQLIATFMTIIATKHHAVYYVYNKQEKRYTQVIL